jgi:hypothetical protein
MFTVLKEKWSHHLMTKMAQHTFNLDLKSFQRFDRLMDSVPGARSSYSRRYQHLCN